MAVYNSTNSDYFRDEWLSKSSAMSDLPPNSHQKSRNSVEDLLTGDNAVAKYVPLAEIGDGGGDKSDEKSVRRRQKAEVDSRAGVVVPTEIFPARLRSTCHGISAAAGKAGAIVGAFGFLYAAQSTDPKKTDAGYPTGIGMKNSLIVLGAINFAGMLFTFLVPESKGKSLEELSRENEEEEEEGVPPAPSSAAANRTAIVEEQVAREDEDEEFRFGCDNRMVRENEGVLQVFAAQAFGCT